jgi:hypothetical protein
MGEHKMKFVTKMGTTFALIMGLVFTVMNTSQAAVVVDPGTGGSYTFFFDALGPITGISGFPGETTWSMTVGSTSSLSFATATDCCTVGDEFGLIFDGAAVAWDTETTTGGGFFEGSMSDLLLTAGTHTFGLVLTAACCSSGGAFMEFGTATAVPVPAALPLFAGGLGFLAHIIHDRDQL